MGGKKIKSLKRFLGGSGKRRERQLKAGKKAMHWGGFSFHFIHLTDIY